MDRKRPRKGMLCVSKRHLRTLCKLQADVISDAILNTTASNEYTCKRHPEHISTSTSYTQCNENIINNDFVHEANENNDTCIQIANYDECRESSNSQSDVQSFITVSSEECEESLLYLVSENANIADINVKQNIAMWALHHHISHTALTSLLRILKQHSCFSALPSHAKSLLKIPRQQTVRTVKPGTYYHFGILNSVQNIIASVKDNIDYIKLLVHIDGLPLTKSSQQQFWPILGSILSYNNVFIIGIYHGNEKPEDANDFLKDFVDEAKELCEKGIDINNRNISCTIEALICDTPAKSFVLCVKGHSGYSSCTKCTTEGEYVHNRICFPQIDAPLRTDNDFIEKRDDNYHKPNITCSLVNISHFKPVTNVPLDYMHLICLGIMRKLLNLWLSGDLYYRLQFKTVHDISAHLVTQLKCYIPIEFARKPRELDCLKLWKATEYRSILLYTGPLVFKDRLERNVYINFVTLHVIMRILSSQDLQEYLDYAHDLIHFFMKTFIKLYGVKNVSHNVHSFVHLVDDVKKFGPVDGFSAFKFENYMQILKRYIRKAEKPLQQVIRRYMENEINSYPTVPLCDSMPTNLHLLSLHCDGPLISDCNNPQYKVMKFNGITLKAGTLADSCCGLQNGAIISLRNITYCTKRNIPVIIGNEFLDKENLFNIPCPSSLLGIYIVHSCSDLKSWPIKNVIRKYVQFPCANDRYAVFPLIHTEI